MKKKKICAQVDANSAKAKIRAENLAVTSVRLKTGNVGIKWMSRGRGRVEKNS